MHLATYPDTLAALGPRWIPGPRSTRPRGRDSLENAPTDRLLAEIDRGLRWLREHPSPRGLIVLITETGVWPTSECHALFRAWRRGLGSLNTSVSEFPGHLFDPGEDDHAAGLMFIAMAFGWGFFISDGLSPRALHHDHDGVFWRTTTDPADVNPAEGIVLRQANIHSTPAPPTPPPTP